MLFRGRLVESETMESACAPESGAPPPPALSFLTATPAGTTSGNHARGGGAHHGGGGVGPLPQLDDAGAQPGDAAAASRDSTVVHIVLVAGPGAGAAAAAAVAVTASADRMGPLAADGCAVDVDMEGVGGGAAAATMSSPQPPPASTRAVVATVGPHVQRPPRKRLHCDRVTSSTVTARAGAATAATRACSSTWLRDRTCLSRTRSSQRRQGAFTAAATKVAGAVSTRRSAGRRQGAARRRAARRPDCGHLGDGAHRGSFTRLTHRPRRRRRPHPRHYYRRRRHGRVEWRVASRSRKAQREEYGRGSASCGAAAASPHPLPAQRGQSHPAVVPNCCHLDVQCRRCRRCRRPQPQADVKDGGMAERGATADADGHPAASNGRHRAQETRGRGGRPRRRIRRRGRPVGGGVGVGRTNDTNNRNCDDVAAR